MRLLLIEDDRMIGESLVRGLGDDGYHVDWIRDGLVASNVLGNRTDRTGLLADIRLPSLATPT
jgi:DNA-binding response OmpR family regulator